MKSEGYKALVHTAAASNLGQMLNRICNEDGIGLVNVVRKPEQAELLRGIGAEHVVDSSQSDFTAQLTEAIRTTGATLAFDAVGGGTLVSDILNAMERAQPPLELIREAGIPVLVASGDHTPAAERMCDFAAEALDAERLVAPGAGHFVQAAPGFAEPFEQFLRSVSPGGRSTGR